MTDETKKMIFYAEQPTRKWSRYNIVWPANNGIIAKVYDVTIENLKLIETWIQKHKPLKAGLIPYNDRIHEKPVDFLLYVKLCVGNNHNGWKQLYPKVKKTT